MHHRVFLSSILCVLGLSYSTAEAGLGKWFKTEFIPTITGKRPLKIKPYIKLTHNNGKFRFEWEGNRVKIKLGDVTLQTSQLEERIRQVQSCVFKQNYVECKAIAQNLFEQAVTKTAVEWQEALKKHSENPDRLVFVGETAGSNKAILATHPRHRNGQGTLYGKAYVDKNKPANAKPIYFGIEADVNAGYLTTDQNFSVVPGVQGATLPFGYLSPTKPANGKPVYVVGCGASAGSLGSHKGHLGCSNNTIAGYLLPAR